MKGLKGGPQFSPRVNKFYVEMDALFMHTINIPKKFAKMFKESMSENIELEGPTGITWNVKMIRSNNTFAMQSGWKDFVTANKLDKKDVLVFTYNGNYSFKVEIFDSSGCEKAAPAYEKKGKIESEESNDSSIRVIDTPNSKVKEEVISLSSSSGSDTETSHEISSRSARALVTRERVCYKRKRTDLVEEPTESDSDEGKHIIVRKTKTKKNRAEKASRLYVIPCKTHLTKAQKEIANRMAQKTHKGSDLFVKILTASNSHTYRTCILNLPDGFACKVLRSKKKKITLLPADLDKRSKICTANYYKNESIRWIGKGWREFTRIYGLKQGDLCLFELRNQDKQGILTMVVHFNHE